MDIAIISTFLQQESVTKTLKATLLLFSRLHLKFTTKNFVLFHLFDQVFYQYNIGTLSLLKQLTS